MKSDDPKSPCSKKTQQQTDRQTPAGHDLEQQYQELRRLREEVRSLSEDAARARGQAKPR
jgi:hypothetical protein